MSFAELISTPLDNKHLILSILPYLQANKYNLLISTLLSSIILSNTLLCPNTATAPDTRYIFSS